MTSIPLLDRQGSLFSPLLLFIDRASHTLSWALPGVLVPDAIS